MQIRSEVILRKVANRQTDSGQTNLNNDENILGGGNYSLRLIN